MSSARSAHLDMGGQYIHQPKQKFHAKKAEVDGTVFASRMEADYYEYLKQLEAIGSVKGFVLQPKFQLQPSFKKHGKAHRAMHYIADFGVVWADGSRDVRDVKGAPTPTFKLKAKLYTFLYDEPLICVTKTRNGWREWSP